MKALDTNVIVRFLINDDRSQGRKARVLFENAERSGERYLIATAVLLETIWVLSAVYDLSCAVVLHALELLIQVPIANDPVSPTGDMMFRDGFEG